MFGIEGLDHIAITVKDLARSVQWYSGVLGLERRYEESWGDNPVFLSCGECGVALFQQPQAGPAPDQNQALIMRHFAFRVTRPAFDVARIDFEIRGVPHTFEDHQISHSIYLKDPDGYEVELTTYEVG